MIQSLNCLRFLSCLNHLISVIKRTTKDYLCDFFPQSAHLLNLSDTPPTFFPFSSFKFWSQVTTFRKCSGDIITVRKRSCGKIMFLHLSVSHYVHGGFALVLAGIHPPPADPPLGRHLLGRPPPQQTATEADGAHPTGMLSCDM